MEEDLTMGLGELQSQLDGMLDRVQLNSAMLHQFQKFEMALLNLNSMSELVQFIVNDSKGFFDLDMISFSLIDAKGEIEQYLDEEGCSSLSELIFHKDQEVLRSKFGLSLRPYVGKFVGSKCSDFFPDVQTKPVSVAIIPLSRRGSLLGSLNLGSFNTERFSQNMATDFIEHMAKIVSICLENNLSFKLLKRTSLVDTLTGVNNRRFLEQRLVEEIDRSQRNGEPLSCFFIDLDFFKAVNDNYGHQAGDQVLATIAKKLKYQLRNNDILARYGGEEFVALLSNTDEALGVEIADRIRCAVKDLIIPYKENDIQVTLSIGIATFVPSNINRSSSSNIAASLISNADEALYQAKSNGRDCVVLGVTVKNQEENLARRA
jgi:diguanylate cyclase (GGDEF)-like protein